MKLFGERLKELRLDKKPSIEALAKKVEISKSALSRWELNQAEPLASSVVVLAKFFNVSTDYLLGLEN